MHMSHWNDGTRSDNQPRIIHDVKNIAYLVSAVYSCDNDHKMLAHDERMLKQLPTRLLAPFFLFYRTGITRCLADMITTMTLKGLNFYNIESLILEQRWDHFAKQQDIYKINLEMMNFFDMELAKSPSNDILCKAFLVLFLENEKLYRKELSVVPIGETISFDHTFKVATNIGYLREDQKWITEYDGLFLVLNGNGQVVNWQLTKSTSVSESESLLKSLCRRANLSLKTIYIDNCCKLRNKISAIFGPDVEVKLDLFHAVQRISKTLPKRHLLTKQCLRDLRLVFRCDGDVEEKRKSATPSPGIITSKLLAFKQKWQDAEESGTKLFRHETFTALENIEAHIKRGCLSNIPPGGGTNKNERFHQHLNSFFHRSRIGVLLAYALLTIIIHAHNSAVKIGGKSVHRPITASPFRNSESMDFEGLDSMGIFPKNQDSELQNQHHWEIDISESSMDLDLIIPVYIQAIKKFELKRCLTKMKMSTLGKVVCEFKEFSSSNFKDHQNTEINDLLNTYGLTLQQISKDGNCFFKAIATNILSDTDSWKDILVQTNLCTQDEISFTIEDLAIHLRRLFVEELLGMHRNIYENFTSLNFTDYETECKKFLQVGFFANIIGDLMPIAIATALQISIVLITDSTPALMYVNPAVGKGKLPAFLIYYSVGVGHYDAAIPYGQKVMNQGFHHVKNSNRQLQIACSCGVNKNSQGLSCSPESSYATRCKCYKNNKKCGALCRCKECKNPFGKEESTKCKRLRQPHLMQVDIPSSKKFAIDRGEAISESIWSDFETLVLKEIQLFVLNDADRADVVKLYNDVVSYSSSSFCTIKIEEDAVFRKKSENQIASKVSHLTKQP